MTEPENLEQQAAFALYNYLGPEIEVLLLPEGSRFVDSVDWLFAALKAFFKGEACPEIVGENVNDERVSDRESTKQKNTRDSQEATEDAPYRRVL